MQIPSLRIRDSKSLNFYLNKIYDRCFGYVKKNMEESGVAAMGYCV